MFVSSFDEWLSILVFNHVSSAVGLCFCLCLFVCLCLRIAFSPVLLANVSMCLCVCVCVSLSLSLSVWWHVYVCLSFWKGHSLLHRLLLFCFGLFRVQSSSTYLRRGRSDFGTTSRGQELSILQIAGEGVFLVFFPCRLFSLVFFSFLSSLLLSSRALVFSCSCSRLLLSSLLSPSLFFASSCLFLECRPHLSLFFSTRTTKQSCYLPCTRKRWHCWTPAREMGTPTPPWQRCMLKTNHRKRVNFEHAVG